MIKPEAYVTVEEAEFADAKLRAAGLTVPKSRTVRLDEPEAAELQSLIELTQRESNRIKFVKYLRVMDKAAGESLPRFFSKNTGQEQASARVDKAMKLLGTPPFQEQLARLIATDIILGNDDRISVERMHFGNLMIAGVDTSPIISPIDSESNLTKNFSNVLRREALQALGQEPQKIVDYFLYGVEFQLRTAIWDDVSLFKKHKEYRILRAELIIALRNAALIAATSVSLHMGKNADEMKKRQAKILDYLGR